jgi:hypothetical protein
MPLTRCIIYTKDICRITGKSDRSARRIMKTIRASHGKQSNQPVSIYEFCNHMGLPHDDITKYLL